MPLLKDSNSYGREALCEAGLEICTAMITRTSKSESRNHCVELVIIFVGSRASSGYSWRDVRTSPGASVYSANSTRTMYMWENRRTMGLLLLSPQSHVRWPSGIQILAEQGSRYGIVKSRHCQQTPHWKAHCKRPSARVRTRLTLNRRRRKYSRACHTML